MIADDKEGYLYFWSHTIHYYIPAHASRHYFPEIKFV